MSKFVLFAVLVVVALSDAAIGLGYTTYSGHSTTGITFSSGSSNGLAGLGSYFSDNLVTGSANYHSNTKIKTSSGLTQGSIAGISQDQQNYYSSTNSNTWLSSLFVGYAVKNPLYQMTYETTSLFNQANSNDIGSVNYNHETSTISNTAGESMATNIPNQIHRFSIANQFDVVPQNTGQDTARATESGEGTASDASENSNQDPAGSSNPSGVTENAQSQSGISDNVQQNNLVGRRNVLNIVPFPQDDSIYADAILGSFDVNVQEDQFHDISYLGYNYENVVVANDIGLVSAMSFSKYL